MWRKYAVGTVGSRCLLVGKNGGGLPTTNEGKKVQVRCGGVESDDDDYYSSDCDDHYNDGDFYGNKEENKLAQIWGPDMYASTDKEEEFAECFRLNQLLGLLSQYGGTHKFPIALM